MKFSQAIIWEKEKICQDTYRFLLRIENGDKIQFSAGQYVFLKHPYFQPDEQHPFSIASSPLQNASLEFCIKVYGDWTRQFSLLEKREKVYISQPQGNFVWNATITHAVFLLGGIGISPIMSMLRFLSQQNKKPHSITILYGNRTPDTIAYKNELESLTNHIPLNIVHIFSHIDASDPWQGYRGFITRDIIEKEGNLQNNPTFFLVGPPIFIEKMRNILSELSIIRQHIKQESLDIRTQMEYNKHDA